MVNNHGDRFRALIRVTTPSNGTSVAQVLPIAVLFIVTVAPVAGDLPVWGLSCGEDGIPGRMYVVNLPMVLGAR